MDATNQTFELACPDCSWRTICGAPQMVEWLQKHRLLRSQADLDAALLCELFRVSAEKFTCPQCGHKGLTAKPSEPLNDEEWGMTRKCSQCGTVIPPERLEVFSEITLCAECQRKEESGELTGTEEYCPRCGNVMTLRTSDRGGITRWSMRCPSCGRR